MTRILIDTNVILDIALKRNPFFEASAGVLQKLNDINVHGFISATTITDIYYISKKEKGHDVAFDFIKSLLQLVEVAGIDKEVIFASLESEVADFEDAIQDASARLNNIEIIITRNISDFEKSNLRIMLPSEFIDYINKKGSAK